MYKILDIENWNRKDHFHFFKQFEEPFFGITTEINCTNGYRKAKDMGVSFFLYYLHQSLVAVNAIEAFKYRIAENNQVLVYEQINASPTINRPDGTFGFSYIDYHPNFDTFLTTAQQEVERVRNGKGLELTNANANVIHYSTVPWIRFTSISHARSFAFKDCIPKISFGKIVEQHKEKKMPVSIHLHHALADGYDVGKFVEHFEHLMNEA